MSLMSFSLHFFEIIPINSFLSSIAVTQDEHIIRHCLFDSHCGKFLKPFINEGVTMLWQTHHCSSHCLQASSE